MNKAELAKEYLFYKTNLGKKINILLGEMHENSLKEKELEEVLKFHDEGLDLTTIAGLIAGGRHEAWL